MNTLDLASAAGRQYRKVSTHNGGEFHGPCPGCGGTDRFHVWPDQGEHGTYWCRKCDKAGDAIDYLREFEGKGYRDACGILGKEIRQQDENQRPSLKPQSKSADSFQPRTCSSPAELWREHAEKLVTWAHDQLLSNPYQLAWLAERGITIKAVTELRLGWNPGEKGKDLYRAREAWGLETKLKDNGKKTMLWLPVGLVIPYYIDGQLHRVRIRRPEGEPRYYVVAGSGMAPMVLGLDRKAFVIVESELDAVMIHAQCGDLVGAISQGNSTARPDGVSHHLLRDALAILVSLDSDEAGMIAATWWRKQYPQAERWPVPVGKDPGDAFKAGADIRAWVMAGLPPALTLPPKRTPAPVIAGAAPQPTTLSGHTDDHTGSGPREISAPPPGGGVVVEQQLANGVTICITDNIPDYRKLRLSGRTVFTNRELQIIGGLDITQAEAATLFKAKQVFGGMFISPPANNQ